MNFLTKNQRFIAALLVFISFSATRAVHTTNAQQEIVSQAPIDKPKNERPQTTQANKNGIIKKIGHILLGFAARQAIQETTLFSHECGHAVVAKVLNPNQTPHIYLRLKSFLDINPHNELFSIGNVHIHNGSVFNTAFAAQAQKYIDKPLWNEMFETAYKALSPAIQEKIEPSPVRGDFIYKPLATSPLTQTELLSAQIALKDAASSVLKFDTVELDSTAKKLAFFSAGGISATVTMALLLVLNSARLNRKKTNLTGIIKRALTPFNNVLETKGLSKSRVIMELLIGTAPLIYAIDQIIYTFLPTFEGADGTICWELLLGKKPPLMGMAGFIGLGLVTSGFFLYKGYKTYKQYFANITAKKQ